MAQGGERMLVEIMIVLVAVFVLGVVLWSLFGLLLLPVFGKNMVTFCFSRGNGKELEMRARAYGWLRSEKPSGGRLVVVDCGLSEQGLSAVRFLRNKYSWVDYCPHEVMEDYIEVLHHCLENGEDL